MGDDTHYASHSNAIIKCMNIFQRNVSGAAYQKAPYIIVNIKIVGWRELKKPLIISGIFIAIILGFWGIGTTTSHNDITNLQKVANAYHYKINSTNPQYYCQDPDVNSGSWQRCTVLAVSKNWQEYFVTDSIHEFHIKPTQMTHSGTYGSLDNGLH